MGTDLSLSRYEGTRSEAGVPLSLVHLTSLRFAHLPGITCPRGQVQRPVSAAQQYQWEVCPHPASVYPSIKETWQQLPRESGFKRLPQGYTQQCLARNTGPSVSAHPRAPPSQYKGCVPPGMAFCGIALPLHGSPRPLSACASQLWQLDTARVCEKKEHHRENAPTRLGYGQAWGCIFLIRD